jgi:hypothetical protein
MPNILFFYLGAYIDRGVSCNYSENVERKTEMGIKSRINQFQEDNARHTSMSALFKLLNRSTSQCVNIFKVIYSSLQQRLRQRETLSERKRVRDRESERKR